MLDAASLISRLLPPSVAPVASASGGCPAWGLLRVDVQLWRA